MTGPKICLIGAGGMSFGPTMVNDCIKTESLRGATLMLHDVSVARLERVLRGARRLNEATGNTVRVEGSTDPSEAMEGADYCLLSAEVDRFPRWVEDYEVPRLYGSPQINGENGGPGAVFHSLRSIRTVLGICDDLQRHCPDTLLVNLTNPMSRVTLAVNRATNLHNVGMCHEFDGGVSRLALLLRIPKSEIRAKASGINHFTFFTEIRHAETGEDLYPRVRRLWRRRFFDFPPAVTRAARMLDGVPIVSFLVDQLYTPLVAHMFHNYGYLPCSVDSHIGEYVPFARDVSTWEPDPLYMHRDVMERLERLVTAYGDGRSRLPLHRLGRSPEEPFKIIEAHWTGRSSSINAVNVPNDGYIPNLPDGAIVEVPALADSDGLHPETMPPVAEGLAELMRAEIARQDLVVEAALSGDPAPAFEAVMNDPNSPPVEADRVAMFEELYELQREVLPIRSPTPLIGAGAGAGVRSGRSAHPG
jgi:alpha-galactosidase